MGQVQGPAGPRGARLPDLHAEAGGGEVSEAEHNGGVPEAAFPWQLTPGRRAWEVATGEKVRTLRLAGRKGEGEDGEGADDKKGPKVPNCVFSLAVTPDGGTLLSGSIDGKVRRWSIADGKCVRTIKGHDRGRGPVRCGV